MATVGSGKVACPTCGAYSGKEGFGRDFPRQMRGTNIPLSNDPVIAKRRSRAARLRRKNATA